jgi:hypothetical protein
MFGSQQAQIAREPAANLAPRLFPAVVESLRLRGGATVLDLGAASGGTVLLFGGCRCRLMFADLLSEQENTGSGLVPDAVAARISQVVSAGSGGRPVDAVLFWNLVNYLEPATIKALMQLLTPQLSRGAVLHLLVEYSATRIPDPPPRLVPLSHDELRVDVSGPGMRPSPGYTPADIQRFMGTLRAEKTVLLGNGMQEFLFRKP